MTEAAFQQARKLMQQANQLRGLITFHKNNVAKWTKIEDVLIRELKHDKAKGPRKLLEISMAKLKEAQQKFANLTFPDPNLIEPTTKAICEICEYPLPKDNICTYCNPLTP